MGDEESIKAEWRLYALEWSVSMLWATLMRLSGGNAETLEAIREQATQSARNKTFPGVDPTYSDLFAAELEAAVDRMWRMAQAMLGPNPSSPVRE